MANLPILSLLDKVSVLTETLTPSSSLVGLVDEDFTVPVLDDEVQLGIT